VLNYVQNLYLLTDYITFVIHYVFKDGNGKKGVMQIFRTISGLILMGISLAYFGVLGAVTVQLGKSALELNKKGLVSLTELTHALQNGHSHRK